MIPPIKEKKSRAQGYVHEISACRVSLFLFNFFRVSSCSQHTDRISMIVLISPIIQVLPYLLTDSASSSFSLLVSPRFCLVKSVKY